MISQPIRRPPGRTPSPPTTPSATRPATPVCASQRLSLALLCCVCLAAPAPAATPAHSGDLIVDCAQTAGELRPLHGGNCGPIQAGELIDLSDFYRQLAVPSTRLHDCLWPEPDVVDIHALFPDFSADPADPASYRFQRTDDYLQSIVNTGSQIVYRLGESIEHTRRKYHVHPPPDPDRWAAICLGIIRHYNHGWADGFHHNIRYWEIWNEPENQPAMWTGSDDDYFRLYAVAARTLKQQFPKLKIGGPSLGFTGRIRDGQFEPGDFALRFLARCRDEQLPLDFFSWHLYTDDPAECLLRAQGLRQTLNRFGFPQAELHFNEWNYLPDNDWTPMGRSGQGPARERFYQRMGGPEGAAFTAAVLINLQDTPVDVANFYRLDTGGFGLFSEHGTPKKVFYAMLAFRRLLATPARVATHGGQPDRLALAAGLNQDRSRLGILLANYRAQPEPIPVLIRNLPWTQATLAEWFVVDATRNLDPVATSQLPAAPGPLRLSVPPIHPAVWLLHLSPIP